MSETNVIPTCPNCGAGINQLHEDGCDWEICGICGCQALGCDCNELDNYSENRIPWTGESPVAAAAREFGWYTKFGRYNPDGSWHNFNYDEDSGENCEWRICNKNDPDARLDLTRVAAETEWDPAAKKYVLKKQNQTDLNGGVNE